jgi:hypothetical protein
MRVEALENSPFIGRAVPEAGDQWIREIIHRKYRIIYSLTQKEIVNILTIHSAARPLDI